MKPSEPYSEVPPGHLHRTHHNRLSSKKYHLELMDFSNERMVQELGVECPFADYVNAVSPQVWDQAQRGGKGAWVQNRWVAKAHAVVSAGRWTAHLEHLAAFPGALLVSATACPGMRGDGS